jgi:hypothetical protein
MTRARRTMDRSLTAEDAAIIKGMLARHDDQSDIAACFLVNGGRISEINTGKRFPEVMPAPADALPPPPPYPSFFDLWRTKNQLWAVRATARGVIEQMEKICAALDHTDTRLRN